MNEIKICPHCKAENEPFAWCCSSCYSSIENVQARPRQSALPPQQNRTFFSQTQRVSPYDQSSVSQRQKQNPYANQDGIQSRQSPYANHSINRQAPEPIRQGYPPQPPQIRRINPLTGNMNIQQHDRGLQSNNMPKAQHNQTYVQTAGQNIGRYMQPNSEGIHERINNPYVPSAPKASPLPQKTRQPKETPMPQGAQNLIKGQRVPLPEAAGSTIMFEYADSGKLIPMTIGSFAFIIKNGHEGCEACMESNASPNIPAIIVPDRNNPKLTVNISSSVKDIEKIIIGFEIAEKSGSCNFSRIDSPAVTVIINGEAKYFIRLEGLLLEKTVIAAEIYLHKGEWKMKTICAGHRENRSEIKSIYGL